MRLKGYKWAEWALDTASKFYRDGPELLAVDTETTGVSFFDSAFCATIAWVSDNRVQSGYFELDDIVAKEQLAAVLSIPTLVFHNAKFDIQKLIAAGVLDRGSLPDRIRDTECIAQLLNEHRPKGLKDLGKSLLGYEDNEKQRLVKVRRKLNIPASAGYDVYPREVIVPYAVNDAELTILVHNKMWPELIADEQLSGLFDSEMKLVLAMLDVESHGIGVDEEYLDRVTKETATRILELELEIEKLIGKKVWYPEKTGQKTPDGCFNPNSHEQVRWVLGERGVEVQDTRSDTLKSMADPFGLIMCELREQKKIYGTFLKGIASNQRAGVIHPWFNLFRPITGRMSSSKGRD